MRKKDGEKKEERKKFALRKKRVIQVDLWCEEKRFHPSVCLQMC